MLADERLDPRRRHPLCLGAEAVDLDRHRVGDADRVRDLQLAAVGEAGGDDVLGRVAGRVGRRAVDLGRILAREGAATVSRRAAVRVDDDLPTGHARVPHRAALDEAAGRVDEHEVALAEPLHVAEIVRHDRVEDVLDDVAA